MILMRLLFFSSLSISDGVAVNMHKLLFLNSLFDQSRKYEEAKKHWKKTIQAPKPQTRQTSSLQTRYLSTSIIQQNLIPYSPERGTNESILFQTISLPSFLVFEYMNLSVS